MEFVSLCLRGGREEKIGKTWLMIGLLMVAVLTFLVNIQPVMPFGIIWDKTYGGTGYDDAHAVEATSDGGYLIAGRTESFGAGAIDFYLVKADSMGNIQWEKTYGGTASEWAEDVEETSDGGYIILGRAAGDFWLVKIDSGGNLEWEKTYDGGGDDIPYDVEQTNDGGYILVGHSTQVGGIWYDIRLIKTDQNGYVEWERMYGGATDEWGMAVEQTSDGGYILAGSTDSFGAGACDIWVIKTDSNGIIQWDETYGGPAHDFAADIEETYGGYIIAGWKSYSIYYPASEDHDFWLVKIDASGTILWDKTYGGTGKEEAWDVEETWNKKGYIVIGYTYPDPINAPDSSDVWLVLTNFYGDNIWEETYGGTGREEAYDIKRAHTWGSYVISGITTSYGAGSCDAWLIKTSFIFHSLTITDVSPFKNIVGSGYSTSINVTVINDGYFEETFNMSLYADSDITVIGDEVIIQTITNLNLPNGTSTTITFLWNTIGVFKGNYTISAYVWPVLGEIYMADNVKSTGLVYVAMVGDIASVVGGKVVDVPDGKVDMTDIGKVAKRFGISSPHPLWDPDCDITGEIIGVPDGKIDMRDIGIVARHFGETDP